LNRRSPLFWEHEGNRAVRDGRWKLVAKENKPWELYDLRNDRTEQNDLIAREPKRARELAAQWDAYAARAHVLPLGGWRDRSRGTNASTATEFTLKDGDHLERADAPNIAGRAFTVTAHFDSAGKDGVIVAQGGTAHGFALYVANGRLVFALRRGNALIATPGVLVSAGLQKARASVAQDGSLSLILNDREPVTARASGTLQQMPVDGLDVGQDAGGLVGPYGEENGFGGSIESVHIQLH
jgi:arylsulfatase